MLAFVRRSALPIAFLLLCAWTLASAPPAAAHAYVASSSPKQESAVDAPPNEITVTFTEELETGVSTLALFDEAGNEVAGVLSADGKKTLRLAVNGLTEGAYRVRWQVLSVDSHTTEGSFRFSVGTPLETSRPQETISLDGGAQTGEEPPAPPPNEQPTAAPEPPADDGDSPPPAAGSDAGSSTPPPGAPQTTEKPPRAQPSTESPAEPVEPVEPVEPDATAAPNAPPTAAEPPLQSPGPDEQGGSDKPSGADRPDAPAEPDNASDGDAASTPAMSANRDEPTPASTPAADAPGSGTAAHDHGSHESSGGALPIAALRTLLRIADVLALAALGGALAFRALLFAAPLAAGLSQEADDWRRRIAAAAFVVFALTGTLHAALLSSQLNAVTFGDVWLRTSIGAASLARIGGAAVMLALAWRRGGRPWTFAASAAAFLLLSCTFPATGHAAAEANRALAIGAHAGHIVAATAWYGGLLGIAFAAARTTSRGALQLVGAFSKAALPLMLVAAASGLLLTNAQLPSIADLATSAYGNILLAKLGLFALVLALGAAHRLLLRPRARAADVSVDRRLVAGIRIEAAIAIALFTVAGWLSTTSPPETATQDPAAVEAGPFHWHVMGDIAHMTIDVPTPVAGERTPLTADVWVPDGPGGDPAEPPELVLVTLIPPGTTGGLQYELRPAPDEAVPYVFAGYTKTHYAASEPVALDRSGDWAVAVVFVVPGQKALLYENKMPVR